MKDLELLAPARNADIGIAAIDCGADAVYIAGQEFGPGRQRAIPSRISAAFADMHTVSGCAYSLH